MMLLRNPNSTNFRIQFSSPHRPPIQLNIEGFPLSVALASHRLQCYLKLYTKVCTAKPNPNSFP